MVIVKIDGKDTDINRIVNKEIVVADKEQNTNKEVSLGKEKNNKNKEVKQEKIKVSIKDLKFTDDATKVMLQNVVKRQQKFNAYERKHLITMISMFVCVLGYLVYLYNEILKPYSNSFGDVFHAMISDSINGYILIIIFGLYATMEYFFKKREKAEKEFHLLRCEIIDKGKDLWREEAWEHRSEVFEMMKENYDINLYHENK